MRLTGLMRLLALGLFAVGLSAWPATAQQNGAQNDESGSPDALGMSNMMAMMSKSGDDGDEKSGKRFPDFSKVTEDMESSKGFFTLWSYPDSAKDKDPEKLLCQIPSKLLGENFMLSTSISGGGYFTGFPLDQRVVKWERLDDQLLLIEPETGFVVNGGEVADVVRRTYPETIRASVKILTVSPGGDPVIDFGGLLKSSFADIGWMSMSFLPGGFGGGGGINSQLSKWTKKKTFELNVEMGVELAVSRGNPPGSYDKKMVHYSFWKLPETDYSPRVADDRVGYFMTTNQDWSKPNDARDLYNRYVDRWNLQKRDPKLALCEPKKPIVFYIEKTVPVRYRRAVRDGILEWNKAYEKIGFVDAVQVRQQTADNEWRDLDPEDMRYSFFRWIVTGSGFAMGPHRANPFTGEIYDADIIFDDSMVRFFEQSAAMRLPSSALDFKGRDPALDRFIETFPQFNRPMFTWDEYLFGENEQAKVRESMRERMRDRGYHCCEYAEGMKQQMAVANSVLCGQPKDVIDRYLYEVIKEVVMHEVGHTLGLRHNFKASSIYTLDEIKRRRETGEPTVGSVMDYNPVLFFADKATEGAFITTTIGPYDYWAIEYGYRPFDATYKGASASEDEPTDSGDKEEEKPAAEEALTASADEKSKIDLDKLPPEILSQIPAEVKELIESGKFNGSGADGGHGSSAGKKSKASKFASAPSGEEKMLLDIASRASEPELAYATDEDTTFVSPDPRNNRFDMAADPINWAESRIELIDQRIEKILEWGVKDQESWYHLRSAFVSLVFEKLRVIGFVGRYAGGQYFNRLHKKEGGSPPIELVDTETQRRALAFVTEHMYGEDMYKFSPKLLNHMAPARWWNDGARMDYSMDFPIHQLIGAMQQSNLFDRFFPNTLRRIHDAELKSADEDKFTVAEYIESLSNASWSDACDAKRASDGEWSNASPFVSDIRRSLQREYLNVVEPLVRYRPGRLISPDLHAMLRYSLKQISDKIGKVMEADLDFASQAHLDACKSRIDRMLEPELSEY